MENHEFYVDVEENIKCYLVERYKETRELKRAVVLLHGISDGHVIWDLQINDYSLMDYLAERDFVVYAPDLRGFGKSSKTNGIDVRANICADDTKKIVNFIKERLEVDKIHLAGASFGAMIAAAYSAKYSQDIEKLALIAPVYKDVGGMLKTMVPSMLELINKGQGYYPSPTEPGLLGAGLCSADEKVISYYSRRKVYCPKNPTGPFLDMVQGQDNDLPTDHYAPLITSPTLLIVAANDEMAPTKNAKLLYENLRMHDKRLSLIPDVSHKLSLERRGHVKLMEILYEWFKG
jgi:pimeloyl-ACP methyl ester carboxylesterase